MAVRLPALRAGHPLLPRGIVRLEGLGKLKKHLNGTRFRDLPACSIVHQQITLPRAPKFLFICGIKCYVFKSCLYLLYAAEINYGKFSYGYETEEIDTNIQFLKHLTHL
jgi:hypothetical protein